MHFLVVSASIDNLIVSFVYSFTLMCLYNIFFGQLSDFWTLHLVWLIIKAPKTQYRVIELLKFSSFMLQNLWISFYGWLFQAYILFYLVSIIDLSILVSLLWYIRLITFCISPNKIKTSVCQNLESYMSPTQQFMMGYWVSLFKILCFLFIVFLKNVLSYTVDCSCWQITLTMNCVKWFGKRKEPGHMTSEPSNILANVMSTSIR